ncbi:hypothetical protein PIIN_00919 [Serendipita indica DSM 11827]|uniref:Uncharacterized protein n=1 Tax=Serendipita indica (strain DSM 11827) TaxID=1109443 RepID=G4T6X6_SERID|nr:hypothetical protein PIIN_00919 [Serendipita indica DSM 11827]
MAPFLPLLALFASVAHASFLGLERRAPANITWERCPNTNSSSRLECATAQVPLDWNDTSKGDIPLSLIRLPAQNNTREGYMFFNPGGPGIPGTHALIAYGEFFQAKLGAGWDIVSWDTRGLLQSGPNITVFANDTDYDAYWTQYQGLGKLSARGNLTQSADVDFFMSQVSAFDNLTMTLNQKMVEKNGDKLKYIGTCANVRDLVYLVDSMYGEGSDVNFWGLSYGTVIGTYLTQMFPERVGRVILDGVYDPEKYANLPPLKWFDIDPLTRDKALLMWAQACAAGQNCTASQAMPNATAEALLAQIEVVLDTAHRNYNGFAWTDASQKNETALMDPNSYSWEIIAASIFSALYDPVSWGAIADGLPQIAALQQNRTAKAKFTGFPLLSAPRYGEVSEDRLDMVTIAIYCSDTVDPAGETTEDLFKAYVHASQNISTLAGAVISANMRSHCHRYTSRAVERLPQKMNKKPKNVVLVIGNSGDHITPFQSARRLASSEFLGTQARLLQFNAPGHGSHIFASTCADDVVRKFIRGTPPADSGNDEADVICDVDITPYGPVPEAWKDRSDDTQTDDAMRLLAQRFYYYLLLLPLLIFI